MVALAQPRYSYTDSQGEHLHRLDGKPLLGTSTVVQCLGKDGLTWWAAEQAAVVCLEAGEHIPGIRQEYEALSTLSGYAKKKERDKLQRKYPIFKEARYAHKKAKERAADPGTDMHACLESYVKDCIASDGVPIKHVGDAHEAVKVFAAWAVDNVAWFMWSEAHCFSEKLWVGGISDCGAAMRGGDVAAIDFKSSSEAYFAQFVQTGGYAYQIEENGLFTADGEQFDEALVVDELIIWPFRATEPRRSKAVASWKLAFANTVQIYKLQQEFEK